MANPAHMTEGSAIAKRLAARRWGLTLLGFCPEQSCWESSGGDLDAYEDAVRRWPVPIPTSAARAPKTGVG